MPSSKGSQDQTGIEKLVGKLLLPMELVNKLDNAPRWIENLLVPLLSNGFGFAFVSLLLIVWIFAIVIAIMLLYPLWLLLRGLYNLIRRTPMFCWKSVRSE